MHTQPLTAYRSVHLHALISISPDEAVDYSPRGKALILNRLRSRLKSERTRGKSGHWAYDLNRHLALSEAFKLERLAFNQLHPITALRAEAENSRKFVSQAA